MNISDENEFYERNPQISRLFRTVKLNENLEQVRKWKEEGKSREEVLSMMDTRVLAKEDVDKIFFEIPKNMEKKRKHLLKENLEWIRDKLKEGKTKEDIIKAMDKTVLLEADVEMVLQEYNEQKHIKQILDDNRIREEFPKKLKYLMDKEGTSIETLGFILDASYVTIKYYLEGTVFPNNLRFLKLCYIFKVGLDFFIEPDEIKQIDETNKHIEQLEGDLKKLKQELFVKERYINNFMEDEKGELKRQIEKEKLLLKEQSLIIENYRKEYLEHQINYDQATVELY